MDQTSMEILQKSVKDLAGIPKLSERELKKFKDQQHKDI
jgi:hypothetical protein